jgi:hypothetical protein
MAICNEVLRVSLVVRRAMTKRRAHTGIGTLLVGSFCWHPFTVECLPRMRY